MYDRLFIGNKLIELKEIDSTNAYMKQFISSNNNEIEGLVVITRHQLKGRGQKGNVWESKKGMNLTFSIFLKSNTLLQNQFLISKVISLGIIDFLDELGLKELKIKWPNDIYCGNKKIAGILIENTLKKNVVRSSVVGIGLNVNQTSFHSKNEPTSIIKELGGNFLNLDQTLNQLLFFIEKRYIILKTGNEALINEDYLQHLYWINESRNFKIKEKVVSGRIIGVNSMGKLQIMVNKKTEEFDLKEIEFLI
ncbi:MAG: biotin--[acetyl-CoA-carboxylase] ligase [Flavobacteriales bacterium]|nr:MAG: biotin--[acetyl-CoA-carboxylase] ligase [Flavobacteriales bacterium]